MNATLNRRDVLKAGLAALVPSWLVSPASRRQIDLTRFCASSTFASRKFDMTAPFYQDEWTYATDARVAVRVRPELGDVRDRQVSLPPASGLPWWDHDRLAGWVPWPVRAEPLPAADSYCPDCNGTGWQGNIRECDRCRGIGGTVRDWHSDTWNECPKCLGNGEVGDRPCPSCRGQAFGVFPDVLPLPGQIGYVAAEYHRLIRDLPGVEFHPCPDEAIRFRFGGGTGLIMPLNRKDAEARIEMARRATP